MGKGKLFYVIGLPRSGKSSYCDEWVAEVLQKPLQLISWEKPEEPLLYCDSLKDSGVDWAKFNDIVWSPPPPPTPRAVISGDDFRTAIHGMSYIPEAEGLVFATMDAAIRALLRRGFDVIVDETCTTEQTLLRYLKIDSNAHPIWIDTPAEVCKQRAIDTGKPYLLGPIERMDAQLQHLKKNWDEIHRKAIEYVTMRITHDNRC